MKRIAKITKLEDLLLRPSFHASEARAKGVSSSALAYYVKVGQLLRLGPGIYTSPKDYSETDWKWEDLVSLSSALPESAVCLITALQIWGLTDEISRELWMAIEHSQRVKKIPLVRFVRMRNMELGRMKTRIGQTEISIFDPTRSVVDAFRLLDPEIAIKALKQLAAQGKLDISKMTEYAKVLRVDLHPYLLMVTT